MKILVTDSVHPILIDRLNEVGHQITYEPNISKNEVEAIIHDFDGIVINSKIVCDHSFIDKAKRLKFIARLGSGIEIVDIPYANKNGIKVFRSPEGNCDAVAEHAIGMLLSLSNNLRQADHAVRSKQWDREANRGWEISERTVAVIGYGHTGKAFCKRIAPFCKRLLVYDKYVSGFQSDMIEECSSLELIFKEADIVSLHIPYTDETKRMVDDDFIGSFNKSFVLINTSRGGIVVTESLIKALDSGRIYGACLDVFENEKPDTFSKNEQKMYDDLFARTNIVVSPHVAGWTIESKYKLANLLADRILMV